MDPTLVSTPSGLEAWITNNQAAIQIVLWAGQMLFWIGITLGVLYAVVQYKRWVNYQMGVGKSGALRTGGPVAAASKSAEPVAIEEFVE